VAVLVVEEVVLAVREAVDQEANEVVDVAEVADVAAEEDEEAAVGAKTARRNGCPLPSWVVWSKTAKSNVWRRFICTRCLLRNTKLSTFSCRPR